MIREPFAENVYTAKTTFKTRNEIKSCLTKCVFCNLVHTSATEIFPSLHKFLRPTSDMKHVLRFHFLPLNITRHHIDFMFFRTQQPWRNSKTDGRNCSNI
jgi:hypothetical protein